MIANARLFISRAGSKVVLFGLAALVLANLSCSSDGGTAPPAAPATITLVGGTLAPGIVGELAGTPLTVQVVDASGHPVANVLVIFTTTSGGMFDPSQALTGADGRVVTQWTLGPVAGLQTAVATITSSLTVTFSDSARAGAPETLALTVDSLAFHALGDTAHLAAVGADHYGNLVASGPVTFTSLDATIATVTDSGLVTAVAPGRAMIRLAVDSLSVNAVVNVRQVAAQVQPTPADTTLTAIGATAQLAVQALDARGHAIANPSVVWSAGAGTGFGVSATGLVTADSAGTGYAVARVDSAADSVHVTVAPRAARVTISPDTVRFDAVGDNLTLRATAVDAGGTAVSTDRLVWQNLDSLITTLTPSGHVAAVRNGTAHIVASLDGAADTAAVLVSQVPVGASVAPRADTLRAWGAQVQLYPTFVDRNGFATPPPAGMVYASAAPSIATVNATGQVTAVGDGSTQISVTAGSIVTHAAIVVRRVASATATTITADSAAVTADGTSATIITVHAKDAAGNPMAVGGNTVTLHTSVGTLSAVADNGDGTYAATLTAPTTVGTATLTGTLDGAAIAGGTAAVAFVAGSVTHFAVEADTGGPVGTVTAGAPFFIRITALDAHNNPATAFTGAGRTVNITANRSILAGGGASAPFTAGVLIDTISLKESGAGAAVSATRTGGAETGRTAAFTVKPGPLDHFEVGGAGGGALSTQTAGAAFAVRFIARDAYGNRATSFTGTATVTANRVGTTGLGVTPAFVAGVLDNYDITLTQASAGVTALVTATRTGGREVGTSSPFAVTPGPIDAAHSTITTAATTLTADGTSTTVVTLQAMDAYGNAIAVGGATVTLAASAGTMSAVTDHGDGRYTATLTAPATAGTGTITGTVGGHAITSGTASVAFRAGAVDHFMVEAGAGGTIAPQTAGTAFSVRVTAQDALGNTVTTFSGAGSTVDLSSNRTLLAGGGTSAAFADGAATIAVSVKEAGTGATLTVTRTGGAESGTSSAFAVAPGATATFAVTPSTTTPLEGDTVVLTAQARDAQGNAAVDLAGQSLAWTLSPATGTLAYSSTTIAANGSSVDSLFAGASSGGATTARVSASSVSGTSAAITTQLVNHAPAFTKGADQTVAEDAGAQTVNGWATAISVGPANESAQHVSFAVSNDNHALFSAQPAISSSGTLTFTSVANANGSATVTVTAHDDGGTANAGVDSSAAQTFTITIQSVNDAPNFTRGADQAVLNSVGAQSVTPWATAISAGPANESTQQVTFAVTNDNAALFSVQPAIAPNGTLTYTPAPTAAGLATVSVRAHDDGGTANAGVDSSTAQTFTITIAVTVSHVTVAASGVSSGGSWVGNTWTPTATASTVLASEVATHLASGPTVITTVGGGSAGSNIVVDGAITWTANALTLHAGHDITINAALNDSASTGDAALSLEYGQGEAAAGNTGTYQINTVATLHLGTSTGLSTTRGSDGVADVRAIPTCARGAECTFLQGSDLTTITGKFGTKAVDGTANADTWIYISPHQLMGDPFAAPAVSYPFAMGCVAGQGALYFPGYAAQIYFTIVNPDYDGVNSRFLFPGGYAWDVNGDNPNLASLELTTIILRACRPWDQVTPAPEFDLFSSGHVEDRGYYVKFQPNAGETGTAYQTVTMVFTGAPSANQTLWVLDYIINIH